MPSVKDLLNKLGTITPSEKALVEKAWGFSQKAHGDRKRFSGEPYFTHPIATAMYLADLGMGPIAVVAGLLHDTVEDSGVSPEIIEKEFGPEVRFLVDGVTKLGKLRYRGAERHIESLRKLFVAMAADIRVLIIKLADRLHNMRTLEHVKPEKRHRIAQETLEIYAPLAERLGIARLKGELEDLAFPYLEPEKYKTIKKLRDERIGMAKNDVEKMAKTIVRRLAQDGIRARSNSRVKYVYSLAKKLERKGNVEKIYDIAALRIIVPTVADCYRALGIVHQIWQPLPGRIKDFIASPKPNGYRSIQTTVFTGTGSIVEVQIRTPSMHAEAEYGIASHVAYKENIKGGVRGFGWLKNLLPIGSEGRVGAKTAKSNPPDWVSRLAGETKDGMSDANEFLNRLRQDFFEHRVFVFTPKGDVVDLPIDASPIDFAYAIHSDIGDHTSGAKVNGKLVTLETPLKNGDVVEIVTKTSSHPSQKWLDLVKTSMARQHIRAALKSS